MNVCVCVSVEHDHKDTHLYLSLCVCVCADAFVSNIWKKNSVIFMFSPKMKIEIASYIWTNVAKRTTCPIKKVSGVPRLDKRNKTEKRKNIIIKNLYWKYNK